MHIPTCLWVPVALLNTQLVHALNQECQHQWVMGPITNYQCREQIHCLLGPHKTCTAMRRGRREYCGVCTETLNMHWQSACTNAHQINQHCDGTPTTGHVLP
ncbi:hypothetical protein PGTUg99_028710 [Puccinia graminis f. sp. tritici]|uniref:Secreted protein n=1 Tax=Puccinia graminis f. sp. tritici TaxID=56615 RepID=A0A5B0QLT5_PUCGR|nr:hypothetical protein PGTUg99_028710 [Puccinia graminis f. sp. tritici]